MGSVISIILLHFYVLSSGTTHTFGEIIFSSACAIIFTEISCLSPIYTVSSHAFTMSNASNSPVIFADIT